MYLYAATVFTPELQDERPLRFVLHRDLYNRTLLNIKTIKPEPSQNKSFSVRDVLSVICSVSNYKLRWFTCSPCNPSRPLQSRASGTLNKTYW